MTMLDDELNLDDKSAAEIAAGSESILDKVKKRRTEVDEQPWFDIPSWAGGLKAQYRVLDRDDIEKMVRRIRARQTGQGKQSGMDADLDFLIKACVGVKAYDIEDDIDEVLTPGYTMQLAHLLDPKDEETGEPIQITNERQLVAYLFKGNTIALAAHGQKVARWMQDTSKPVEDPS